MLTVLRDELCAKVMAAAADGTSPGTDGHPSFTEHCPNAATLKGLRSERSRHAA
jgi:hypothetical protein